MAVQDKGFYPDGQNDAADRFLGKTKVGRQKNYHAQQNNFIRTHFCNETFGLERALFHCYRH